MKLVLNPYILANWDQSLSYIMATQYVVCCNIFEIKKYKLDYTLSLQDKKKLEMSNNFLWM